MNTALHQIQQILAKASRYNDLLLAAMVVVVIGLMVMPIPPEFLDVLLATNLCISSVLLMMALYIPGALAFSTFPSLLLFTTLFRLALNITTTRLILLKAEAGHIIFTFGNFVVGGNFIVGAVIFLIITLIQFLVITKGAERVAEVGARFSLDAMPGKQMSIDADMRAGLIDINQAKHRRSELERESQLYGAMDGAMKFVKGDAIAGLIIIAINIIAGLAIGVLQKGMDLDRAVKLYSILTIGDGLVSQMPALLVSITAGIIVTRVGSEEGSSLGKDVGKQFFSQPKALMIGGVICLALALVPGFPKIPFLFLGALIGAVGFSIARGLKATANQSRKVLPGFASAIPQAAPTPGELGEEFAITVPLMLDVDASVASVLPEKVLNEELVRIRQALYHDLGVPFPGVRLRMNKSLSGGTYKIYVQEVPVSQGILKPNELLVQESEETLNLINVPFTTGDDFIPGIKTVWVANQYKDELVRASIEVLDAVQMITFHLSLVLKRYAGEFLGLQETKFLLDQMEKLYPEVVREIQRVMPIQRISEIFQRLVQEEISIRDLRTICQSLIEWGQKEKEPVLLTEYVRSNLKRYISYKFSGGQNILTAYLVDQSVEEAIRKSVRQTSSGSFLALDPEASRTIVDAVKEQVGNVARSARRPVVLTSMDVRRYLKKLIELDLPELAVLSYQELTEEINIQPLGRIAT